MVAIFISLEIGLKVLRMGFVKRRASTAAKMKVDKFDELKAQYLFDIKANIEMDEIPHELVMTRQVLTMFQLVNGQWRKPVVRGLRLSPMTINAK